MKEFKLTMKKIIIYSILFGFVLNLISMIHQKSIPCGPGCWGGTVQWGFPLVWFEYGVGDVITGMEWAHGKILWSSLILNIIFWFIVSVVILGIILIIKTK